jgi:hypothetical protein
MIGANNTQKQKQTNYHSWMVKGQTPGGGWIVSQKLVGVISESAANNMKVMVDSTKNLWPAKGADGIKAQLGAEITFTMDKDFQVTKVEGRDEVLKKLAGVAPADKAQFEVLFSEEILKKAAEETFGSLPANPVKKGDQWKYQTSVSMGPLGVMRLVNQYTYDGLVGKLHRIPYKGTVQWLPSNAPAVGGGLPLKVTKVNLNNAESTGTMLFDGEAGMPQSAELNLKLQGTFTLEINGMESNLQVSLTQKQTTNVSSTPQLRPPTP